MRRRIRTNADLHSDWLAQFDTEGPFLALPVVKKMWPNGVDRLGDTDDRLVTFKLAFVQWQRAFDDYTASPKTPEAKEKYAAVNRAWIDVVLDQIAEWDGLRTDADVSIQSPGEQITVRATGALEGRGDDLAALVLVVDPTTSLRETGLDGWAATDIDRMAVLLRKAQVEAGIVTDGQWWAIVWAKDGKPTGSGMVNALSWAEEPLLRDAFFTLINQRRFRAADPEQRLARLFERSELEAEEITEALGTQVRKSVELLVQAFSEARLHAKRHGDPDPLTPKPDDVYQAAVTVMMRIVFLLFAEERDMLPTEQLYWESYAIKDLLDDLKAQAANGEEHLDESYDAWHRLLAVSQALYAGVNYDEMRMPAYGGSLLDPDRFSWLYAADSRGLRLKVSDRVMMHVLESVQAVVAKGERRRISFRDVDVEQIGYIYEGLLGYSCAEVADDVVVGLVGKDGEEPEIDASTLQRLYDESHDAKSFSAALLAWVKEAQPAATPLSVGRLTKLYDAEVDDAEMRRLLTPVSARDSDLLDFLVDWSNYIRRDLRGIPLVIPVGGLVVVETPSRKNAGAHYTPRSLAEEVVLHALQPLVYEPGPLQTNDQTAWQLNPAAEILDLKVADIAAGSGAFLVAAARYLAERLVEAWTAEDMLDDTEIADADDLRRRALREVIARCLYGADINPMAVEMCKLSLWLVSMDKSKPFSFVDDKIFCGNALLGITSLDQLRYLHIYPDPAKMDRQLFVDIDEKISTATRLRHELASPVHEQSPMRSTRGKMLLLQQVRDSTDELRLIADGLIAAGLPLGGKPGRQLDDAYKTLAWDLHEAFPRDGSGGDRTNLVERIYAGLTPTVETDYERWTPLHWAIEAPDVVVEHGGFDTVLGNPPFLGGKKISPAMGVNVREWLTNAIAGRTGNGDLVAYFFLRATELLRDLGTLGLVATNTIAQGDTREVGLDQMVAAGFAITRAVRSRSWPASAVNLEYSAVWGTFGRLDPSVLVTCDNELVRRITPLLEPAGRTSGNPVRLVANRDIAFQGVIILGMGFLLDPSEAAHWIAMDRRNADVLFPYLGGEDLNSRWDLSASRWVIDFGERPLEEAASYTLPWERVMNTVRSERLTKDAKKYPRMVHEWWKFWNARPALRSALAVHDEVLAVARVSKYAVPARVSTRSVFHEKVVVFATDSHAMQALLASNIHQLWVMKNGSSLGSNSTNYSITDSFETFPLPPETDELHRAGREIDRITTSLMSKRRIGLTSLYNMVHSQTGVSGIDADIISLRGALENVDKAVLGAFGWADIDLQHGIHRYRNIDRWAMSDAVRGEIFDRLLEENHRRARAEGQEVPEGVGG